MKRPPFVTRVHFVECAGNRAQPRHKTVQETHGLTSCAEWTGVPLSLLLKEAGVSVLSGTAFGNVGANHLRISYANSRANITTALERMRSVLEPLAV